MFQFRFIAASVTAAALLAAMPAAAAVKIARYSGTVVSGTDQTGVFAAPGSDLTGYSWVATYTYDKTLGGVQNSNALFDSSYGGFQYGTPGMTPILSASITINGVTRSVAGTDGGNIYTSTAFGVGHFARDYSLIGGIEVNNYIQISGYPVGAPTSLDQNFGPVASTGGGGIANWATYDFATGTHSEFASADLGTNTVYSVGNAVPEPASWAMLIAGFGLTGAAMRRRRSAAVAA